jgi:hypothetical protein
MNTRMERPVQLLAQIHHRKEFWKIAVKVIDKWNLQKDGKHSLEMLVVDAKVSLLFTFNFFSFKWVKKFGSYGLKVFSFKWNRN